MRKTVLGSPKLRIALERLASGLDRLEVRGGQPVVVAFSGGADSAALLALLTSLPRGRRLELEAVHVDHGLRPESADDARRAMEAARTLGTACRVVTIEASGKGGLEAVARRGRYAALAAAAAGRPILTAHTADDQAETVLYRLARGTGTRGLAGIRPRVRIAGGTVLRPLLEVERALLHETVRLLSLPVVEDPSNRSLRFARNRLRHEVLPALEAALPGASARLARAARLATADERLLESLATRALGRLRRGDGLDTESLVRLPEALRGRVIRRLVEDAGGRVPSEARVAEVLSIARGEGGELHLPAGIRVTVDRGILAAAPGLTGRRR
ncbi:tRNA lysidine(34) synthetase TilS [Vulgatibacter incomptus]|uniref:tRNA(Ile)-lysidine synthase n=1 Tax=Vulgatibacter incomptus TaxID=1391653 RepID=A0A0K1PDN7_9BACT|nr:tRNA lysidine(34) synthetase TilS [Vulgatibacter incomptus]AKU91635.1 tRNA(Ile)-lysidine synthetase [Vulgatibacter incomptus]